MLKRNLFKMNGIFAVEKPSGVSSSHCVAELQHKFTNSRIFAQDLGEMKQKVFQNLSTDKSWSQDRIKKKAGKVKIKIGHGGTLDPMASGVLVIGIGSGTKKLQYYLGQCNKVYETKALLGMSTTTGDAEGEILTKNETQHITKELIEAAAQKFIGDVKQTPPIFSALKMNGKPLYDYAREGKPLPFPIKTRDIKIADIKVHKDDLLSIDHEFETLKSELDENGQPKENALFNNPTLNDSPLYFSRQYLEKCEQEGKDKEVGKPRITKDLPSKLPLMHLTCDVGSGTYIRSLISDIGRAAESSAYMVELIRSRQSDWVLGENTFKMTDFDVSEDVWGPVLKRVLEDGSGLKVSELMKKIEEEKIEEEKIEEEKTEEEKTEQGKTEGTIPETASAKESEKESKKESDTADGEGGTKRSIDQVE